MATKQGTRARDNGGQVTYTWTGMAGGDVGTAVRLDGEGLVDVQVIGTLGTSVPVLEGSMDGTNWATLTLSPTPWVATTISRAQQRAFYIRPNIGAGTGASLTVIALTSPNRV